MKKIIALLQQAQRQEFPNQSVIELQIERIAQIERKLQKFMKESGFQKLCADCPNVCCARFILELALKSSEVLYFVARQKPQLAEFELKKEDWLEQKCIFLRQTGCVLAPDGRPRMCISYFCQFPFKEQAIALNNELAQAFYRLKCLMEEN